MSSSRSKLQLYSYQWEAVHWIVDKGKSGVFLGLGLGKTIIGLTAFKLLKQFGKVDKLFIIAPLRVAKVVWPDELARWDEYSDMSIAVLHGPKKAKEIERDVDIYVINPEGLAWLTKFHKKFFDKHRWHLIVDESSMFKNSHTNRFRTMRKLISKFQYRTIMTATPAPNGLMNLFAQIFLVDGGERLGKYMTHFRDKYFEQLDYMGYTYGLRPGAAEQIMSKIKDIVMSKTIDDVLELPERRDNYIRVELDKPTMTFYHKLKQTLVAEIKEKEITASTAAVLSNKLKQVSNGGVYNEEGETVLVHNEKTDVIREMVDSLDGRPLMIFYEYKHDAERICQAIPNAVMLNSGDAKDIIDRWNASKIPVLLLHPASAGHGLNLQKSECHDVVWYSITWNLEHYQQAIGRVHRQGVKHKITIHHIVAKETIDERIIDVLGGKATLQSAVIQELKQ